MKGICFKEPLFHATIEGRKTQTRRIMSQKALDYLEWREFALAQQTAEISVEPNQIVRFSRYKVGDVVYLKEPYCYVPDSGNVRGHYVYRFNGDSLPCHPDEDGWENKLFMPGEAARYFIRITAVRAERLRYISDEDCMKEGIEYIPVVVSDCGEYPSYGIRAMGIQCVTPIEAYAALINKINGHGTWDSNPWVWVYDYELHPKDSIEVLLDGIKF